MACWHCLKHKEHIDKDAAWRNQNKEMAENPVYRMVNLTQDGDLRAVYEDHGPEGVRAYCVEFMSLYLYNGGRTSDPHTIKEVEYTRWRHKFTQFNSVSSNVRITPYLSDGELLQHYQFSEDPAIKFQDHQACWDLALRGGVGETPFHLCFLHSTPIYIEIAKVLLELYPNLILDIYEAEEYYGESALHFAVVHNDLDAVKLLVEKGANINQRATGRFFLPEDQKNKRSKKSNYEGYAYYGEYPLAFAACFGHETIYDYLISQGADPNLQDSFGNTVLHMVVIRNMPDMYSYACRHPIKKANHWIKNYYSDESVSTEGGLTPLALASTLGRHQIFEAIMDLNKVELWRFSNVNCFLVPIHAVDSIGPGGEMNWNSAVMITINGTTEEHTEMLQGGVMKQLLDEKWDTYIKRRFFQRLAVVCCHLVVLFIAVALRPKQGVHQFNYSGSSADQVKDGFRWGCEALNIGFCFIAFIMFVKEMKFFGFVLFFLNLRKAPFKAVYFLGCFLLLSLVPLRLLSLNYLNDPVVLEKLKEVEETILALSLPMVWTMLLFFARVTKSVGPLINIIFIYTKKDLLPCMVIVVISFLTFALAFHYMFKTVPEDHPVTDFKTVQGSLMSLLHFTYGEFGYEEFVLTRYPGLTMIVFLIFMVFTPILLLNMLIAMMASTFVKIIEKSEKDWVHQWAKIVILLERTFSKEELLAFQTRYSVKIDKPPDALSGIPTRDGQLANNLRGLMVIKSTRKTKAKQRKDAIRHWKMLVKEVIRRIKVLKEEKFVSAERIQFQMVFPDVLELPNRSRERSQSLDFGTTVDLMREQT